MISRVTDYPGYLIRFGASSTPTKTANLLLHGFPANGGVKNLDLAVILHQALEQDIYLLHYRGLGESPGAFKFTDSIKEVTQLVDQLTRSGAHEQVRLIGHSWGGLIALNAALNAPEKIGTALLISPLCDLSRTEPLYEWFLHGVRQQCPGIFGDLAEIEIREDLDRVIENHLPSVIAEKLAGPLRLAIIQGRYDDTTPASTLKRLLPRFSISPEYIELEQDHSFSQSRTDLAETIVRLLKAT